MSLAPVDPDLPRLPRPLPLALRGLRRGPAAPREPRRSPAPGFQGGQPAHAQARPDPFAQSTVVELSPAPSFQARLVAAIPDLKRLASRLTGVDAMDLVQETCRRALDAQAQFTTGGDLKPWLFSILRNIHLDECRRTRRLVSVADGDELGAAAPRDDKPLWTWVSEEQLERALDSLSPSYRCVYTLFAVEHERYVEIARRLGISANTVGTRLIRARTRLRAFLMRELAARACGRDLGPG